MIGSGSLCNYSEGKSSGNFVLVNCAGLVVETSLDDKVDFVRLIQLIFFFRLNSVDPWCGSCILLGTKLDCSQSDRSVQV